jgi:glutathione S-transferase
MMASVLKIARNTKMLEPFPRLLDYQDHCLDRPAYRKAVEDQKVTIAAHTLADMRYVQVESENF